MDARSRAPEAPEDSPEPRCVEAGNAGPFTLDGTRTWVLGARDTLIIDPGPDVDAHVRAVVASAERADRVTVLLTHHHADHAGCARKVARVLGGAVAGPAGSPVDSILREGDELVFDGGCLRALHTPGHTEDHLCFHWTDVDALFAGDLLLGRGNTTWVAEYPGCVADYLDSLERLKELDLRVIYPAHGPPLEDPAEAIARFESHRRERIDQVRRALDHGVGPTPEALLGAVYGQDLPSGMAEPARQSLAALLEYVQEHG